MQTPVSNLEGSKIMEIASEKRLPLLIHTGRDDYSDSNQLIRLAKKYPSVNICAAHFGYFRKNFLESLCIIPNLFTDTCILSALLKEIKEGKKKHISLDELPPGLIGEDESRIFREIVEIYGVEDKIMFGSDMKWTYHVDSNRQKEIELAFNLDYPENKKDKWLYQNAKKFLRV